MRFKSLTTLSFVIILSLVWGEADADIRILTMQEAIETAYRNHPAVRASEYALDAARAEVNVARGGFLPTLDFNAGYTRATGNLVPQPGTAGLGTAQGEVDAQGNPVPLVRSHKSYNFFNFGLTLEQPIWDFGRTLGAYEASKAASDAARENVTTTRLDTWFRVVTAYYGVLAAQEMVGVARRTRDQSRLFADRAEGMYEVGARPRIDVVRTEADAQAAEAALVSAGETLNLASSSLLAAMGTTERFTFQVSRPVGPAVDSEPPILEEAVLEALDVRPERAAMKAGLRAQEGTLTSAEGEYYPTLSANGAVTEAGVEIDNMVWNWQVGVGLTFPVLSFATTMCAVEAAEAKLRILEADLDGLDLYIRLEVEQARARIVETAARIRPVKAALKASSEAMTFALERYKVGEGSQVELLDAQRSLADAEAALVRTEYDLALAWTALWRAIGRVPDQMEPSTSVTGA